MKDEECGGGVEGAGKPGGVRWLEGKKRKRS